MAKRTAVRRTTAGPGNRARVQRRAPPPHHARRRQHRASTATPPRPPRAPTGRPAAPRRDPQRRPAAGTEAGRASRRRLAVSATLLREPSSASAATGLVDRAETGRVAAASARTRREIYELRARSDHGATDRHGDAAEHRAAIETAVFAHKLASERDGADDGRSTGTASTRRSSSALALAHHRGSPTTRRVPLALGAVDDRGHHDALAEHAARTPPSWSSRSCAREAP